nr:PhF00089.1 [Neoporphyra haitanensis]
MVVPAYGGPNHPPLGPRTRDTWLKDGTRARTDNALAWIAPRHTATQQGLLGRGRVPPTDTPRYPRRRARRPPTRAGAGRRLSPRVWLAAVVVVASLPLPPRAPAARPPPAGGVVAGAGPPSTRAPPPAAPSPLPPLPVATVAAAAGGGHTLLLGADGRLRACGYCQYGQLGVGDRTDGPAAAAVPLPAAAVAAGAGRYHSVALTDDGRVWSWGGGKNGRLGGGDDRLRVTPGPVDVSGVAAADGRVAAVVAGYHSNVLLTVGGGAYAWGWGAYGQLGVGDTADRRVPCRVATPAATRLVAAAVGDRHALAVDAAGGVWAWGSNEFGQLGVGAAGDTRPSPVAVAALRGVVVATVSAGDRHSAAVTTGGAVYTWGCGADGQLGRRAVVAGDGGRPAVVADLLRVRVVAVGGGGGGGSGGGGSGDAKAAVTAAAAALDARWPGIVARRDAGVAAVREGGGVGKGGGVAVAAVAPPPPWGGAPY